MIDGRTAERTMGPEVQRDDRIMQLTPITQLTPIMGRRGMWDEREVYPSRSYRSHALEEGYLENQSPPRRHEVDQGRSPDLFDSPPRRDSAYHTAMTDRINTRRTSGRPREQQSRSKRTKSERKDEADAKASSTRHRLVLIEDEVTKRRSENSWFSLPLTLKARLVTYEYTRNVLRPDLVVIPETSPEVHLENETPRLELDIHQGMTVRQTVCPLVTKTSEPQL